MAYALHRRTAFRQGVSATGWNFDLSKSEYLNSATLLNAATTSGASGTAISPDYLFLTLDSSSLLVLSGGTTRRYDFPANHYGDIFYLQNAKYSYSKDTNMSPSSIGILPFAFSPDGLHFVRQGLPSGSIAYEFYSCALDSAFDISSIKATAGMNMLAEYTGRAVRLAYSADGLYFLILGSNTMRSYYLSSPFDVSSASLVYTQVSLTRFTNNCGISAVVANPSRFCDWQFSPDGFTLVSLWSQRASYDTGIFFVFKLSAPFNISTMSLDSTWDLGTNYVRGFTIDRLGQNLYVARDTTVQHYALSA